MAGKILGIDIGNDSLKLALCRNGQPLKTAQIQMPVNLVKEGRVTSPESMGELIRSSLKEHRMSADKAAVVLPQESCYVRNITMPLMTADQVAINIPYEFNDYITDELKNYVFDYAVLDPIASAEPASAEEGYAVPGEMGENSEKDGGESIEVMAAAAPMALIDELRGMLRKSGLKLVKAAPAECAYISLLRSVSEMKNRETCIIDLGYRSIRMYMFRGDRHMVTRVLELGMSNLDDIIADTMSVDVHLAHTYLLNNYGECQTKDFCVNAYNNIAVELMRAMNFYRFSNPDSQLEDAMLCGGGAMIEQLRTTIGEMLDVRLHRPHELLGGKLETEGHSFIRAVGITID